MSKIDVYVRMDSDLKQEFKEFCEDAGLSMSTAINLYVRKCLRANKILFYPYNNLINENGEVSAINQTHLLD